MSYEERVRRLREAIQRASPEKRRGVNKWYKEVIAAPYGGFLGRGPQGWKVALLCIMWVIPTWE